MYDKNYKRWRERQAVLRSKRMSVQKADDDYYITATYLLKLASKASILFERSEAEEKRLLLNMVVQNATLNGTIVDYDLKKPFDTVLVSANSQSWLARWDDFRTLDWSEMVESPRCVVNEVEVLVEILT